MRRLVALFAALAPAACFKLPWSRSAAPKSGGYQLGDISKAVYQTWKDQKDGKATPLVSDVYDYGYRGRSEYALQAINFAATPVHSASWYDVAPGLRTHGAYTTTVESDITKHTTALLSLIDMYEVTRLVFTGHSLAGGTASRWEKR